MSDVAFLQKPGALSDIGIDDPEGRCVISTVPVMATPAVAAGVIIGAALVNAFVAGRDGGAIGSTEPVIESVRH